MAEKSYQLEVRPDFIERQSRCSLETGLAELIWNSLDADATRVDVETELDILGSYKRLTVKDDGTGIAHSEAPALFKSLGGSWKNANRRTKKKNRELHGKEGRGRFRALSIGSLITWDTVYEENGGHYRYKIRLNELEPALVYISDPEPTSNATGTTVKVENIKRSLANLHSEDVIEYLSNIFAVYLMYYRDANVFLHGHRIDPEQAIKGHAEYSLPDIVVEDKTYAVNLTIIEWNTKTRRSLFLVTEKGFPVIQLEGKIHANADNFSAFVLSSYFPEIADSGDVIAPFDRREVKGAIDAARQQIKAHFRAKGLESGLALVETWKAEKVYPFEGDAADSIERAERQMFETVAVAVSNSVPEFEEAPRQTKALHLRLLRHAIEKSPEELQLILTEVLKLPNKKQKELAELLEHSELSDIISAAAVVGERIRFLTALRSILMDTDLKKTIKERSQLHKILETNTWVFGERYNLWASDKELTTVLKKCAEKLGDDVVVDENVKIIDKARGIVDLVLGRTNKAGAADEYDNLVIELKAPNVNLNSDHVVQIEKYAEAVASDDRFHRVEGVRWHFWLIADSYDAYVKGRIEGGPNPRLRLIQSTDRVRVGIKTWGEVLDDNFARLHFVQSRLNYDASEQEALTSLQREYSEILAKVQFADLQPPDLQIDFDGGDEAPPALPAPQE